MDIKKALEILEINNTNITLEILKKNYHRLALQKHPDKNGNTLESTETFKEINEAYHYLKRELCKNNFNPIDNYDNLETEFIPSLYIDILKIFIKSVIKGNYSEIITEIINDIIFSSKKISVKLFENLDKDTVFFIYIFLSNNRLTFHLSEDILEEIRQIVVHKYDNVHIYKLNPCINDLLNNNLYKLYIDDILYLVPLWHNKSYFDGSNCEIIVICYPDLPESIKIDEENNIHTEIFLDLVNDIPNLLKDDMDITIKIGNNNFPIYLSKLYIKKQQYYIIKNEGITKIKDDIYDISEKGDIIVKINII